MAINSNYYYRSCVNSVDDRIWIQFNQSCNAFISLFFNNNNNCSISWYCSSCGCYSFLIRFNRLAGIFYEVTPCYTAWRHTMQILHDSMEFENDIICSNLFQLMIRPSVEMTWAHGLYIHLSMINYIQTFESFVNQRWLFFFLTLFVFVVPIFDCSSTSERTNEFIIELSENGLDLISQCETKEWNIYYSH